MSLAHNQLLDLLPPEERARLLAACELVTLAPLEVLCRAGAPTGHVYFPVEGSVSLMTRTAGEGSLQVGLVGREGMVGVQVALGVNAAPLLAQVQDPGRAWRMGSEAFGLQCANSAALRQILKHYVHVLMCQLASSVACLRAHLVGPRLARWLLMCQDRAASSSFTVTHETLAHVLGVRRVSVTRAAGLLQTGGFITYSRGKLCVTDRPGLEHAACACYALDRQAYDAVLGGA